MDSKENKVTSLSGDDFCGVLRALNQRIVFEHGWHEGHILYIFERVFM